MALFPFRHTPEGLAYGDKPHWLPAADGQAPTVGIPVRLLGVDAPEARYGGASRDNPGKLDGALASFLAKAGDGLDAGLKAHLEKRLVNGASTRQVAAGEAAWRHFEEMVKRRLDRGTSKSGKPLAPRSLFCMASKAPFDRHGRLHAYVNASYDRKEREAIPPARRPTFNLEMLQAGQAVSLLVYPNIPGAADLELVQAAVRTARTKQKGFWRAGEEVLLPYEFRWIVDTIAGKRRGPDRYCADLASGRLHPPQRYHEVLPEDRLFFYPEHLVQALSMGFVLTP